MTESHANLTRVTYVSRTSPLMSGADFAPEIERILETARRNNARAAVTGALIYNRSFFGQVLEGPAAAVDEVFERIQADPRHADVVVLGYESVEARAFPDWSMGFVGTDTVAARLFGNAANSLSVDPRDVPSDRLFATLHALAVRSCPGPEIDPGTGPAPG